MKKIIYVDIFKSNISFLRSKNRTFEERLSRMEFKKQVKKTITAMG